MPSGPPTKRLRLDSLPSPVQEDKTNDSATPTTREASEVPVEDEGDHCSICLQTVEDRTVLPRCSHEFCFDCILVWTEQSRRCPLCSQDIGEYLIHRIRSKYDYQKHYLHTLRTSPRPVPLLSHNASRGGSRRRRRVEWGRRERRDREREEDQLERAISKRRWIYEHNLYAKHVASNTFTRYKAYPTPAQFAASPDYISRATAFIRRELRVWPNMDVEFLTTFILSLMKSIDIRSESAVKLLAEFLDMDTPYVVGARHTNAEHFAHELYSYIRSPYRDLYVYDDVVQYDVSEEVPPPPVHQARSSRWQHEPEPGPSRRLGYLSPRVRDDYESPRARSTGESPLRSPASSISSRERSRDSLRHYRRSSISGGRVCQGKARGYDDEHEDQRLAREYGLDERTPGEESQRARTRARSRSRSRPSASRDCPEQRVPREPENHDTPIVTARDKGKHRATEAPQAEVGASPNDGVPVGSLPTPSLHSTPNEPSPKVAHGNPAPRTRPFRLKDLVQAHLGTAPAISRTTRSKTSSLQRAVSDTATEPSITPQSHAPSSAPVDETETSPHRSESTLTTKGAAGVSASLSAPQIMARTRARLAALRNESVAGVQPSAYSQKPEDTSSQSHEGPDHPFGNPPTDESGDTSVNPASKSVDMARRRLLNKLVREKRDLRSSVHTGLSPPATSALTEGNQGDSSGIGEGNETGDASAAMEARLRNEALLHVRLAAEKRVAASAGRAGQTHVNGFQGSSALAGSREEALKARLHERRR